jgi:hypothetical protein
MKQRRSLPEDVPNVVDTISSRRVQSEPRSLDRTYSSFQSMDDDKLINSDHYYEGSHIPSSLDDSGDTRRREKEDPGGFVTPVTPAISPDISSRKLSKSLLKDRKELSVPKHPTRPPEDRSYPEGFTTLMKDIEKLCQAQQETVALQVDIRQRKRLITLRREKMLKWDNKIMTLNHRVSSGDTVDPSEFKKAHAQAQKLRNRLGPLEDALEREEENLNRLEMLIFDIGDRIQVIYSRLKFRQLEDDDNNPEYPPSETGSHISFESNSEGAAMTGLPVYSISDVSSVGARNPHWFGDNVDNSEQHVREIKPESEGSNTGESRQAALIENRVGSGPHHQSFPTLADSSIRTSEIESIGDWSLGTRSESPKPSPRRLIATLEEYTVAKQGSIVVNYNFKPHTSGLFRTSGTETFSLWSGPILDEETCPNLSSMTRGLKQPMRSRETWEVGVKGDLRAQVNRWLLHNLMSSTVEWRLFEAELQRSLPPNVSLPQELWEDDFKDLWSQDDLGDKAPLVSSISQSAEAYRGSQSSAP